MGFNSAFKGLIKETREEKKQVRSTDATSAVFVCVCVCFNSIQFPKENCRNRDIWDDTLETVFTVKSSV